LTAKSSKTEKSTDSDKDKWFEKPLTFILGLTSIFSLGYGFGSYKADLEQQVVTIRREQECNERVAQEKEKCAEYRRTVETEKMDNLTKTIESLKGINK
jgi:hypothetical protein